MGTAATSEHQLTSAADYQQLIEDIESLMASSVDIDSTTVERLFARYEQAIKTINARLRECDQLLRKGLRSEALERSDVEPALLDLFLIVDFPDRESWEETVRQCGFTPVDLLVGVATDLIDARADEKPLAELKYQMRLHALARSPLSIRIDLMRKLANQDSASIWDEDLKVFERARHNQLPGEISFAIKSGDASTLEALHQELQSADWLTPPPKALLSQVSNVLKSLQRQQARDGLQTLESELIEAFGAFDVERGRTARDRWQKLADGAALPASDPLMMAVTPALQWLHEQDQQAREEAAYQVAVDSLVRALDAGASREDLKQKYDALIAVQRGIPEDLLQRLREQLQSMDRKKRRTLQLQLAVGGAAVLLVLVLVVMTIRGSSFRSQVAAQAKILNTMLANEEELPNATEHFTKLEHEFPALTATAEMKAIKADLEAAKKRDDARQGDFTTFVQSTEQNGAEPASLNSIGEARISLGQAEKIARYRDEKAKIESLRDHLDRHEASLKKKLEDEWKPKLEAASHEFTELNADPLENLSKLESLKGKVQELDQAEGISGTLLQTRGTPLLDKIEQAIEDGRRQQMASGIINDLNASIGDFDKFTNHMTKYVNLPDLAASERSKEFARAMNSDALLVKGLNEWITFLAKLSKIDLTALDATKANHIRAEAEKLLKDYPGFEFAPKVNDAVSFLSKTSIRLQGSQSMEGHFDNLMYSVQSVTSKGDRYYIQKPPPKDSTGALNVKFYTDSQFQKIDSMRLTSFEFDIDFQSPQAGFKEKAVKLLDKLRENHGKHWDETFINILNELHKNPKMDPYLKVQLIQKTLSFAGQGSSFVQNELKMVSDEIDRKRLDPSVNWVTPKHFPETVKARETAEKLLKTLEQHLNDFAALSAKAKQEDEWRRAPKIEVPYRWIGWLYRDKKNKWTCEFGRNSRQHSSETELYVLTRSKKGDVTEVLIGKMQRGKFEPRETEGEFYEGRFVLEKTLKP